MPEILPLLCFTICLLTCQAEETKLNSLKGVLKPVGLNGAPPKTVSLEVNAASMEKDTKRLFKTKHKNMAKKYKTENQEKEATTLNVLEKVLKLNGLHDKTNHESLAKELKTLTDSNNIWDESKLRTLVEKTRLNDLMDETTVRNLEEKNQPEGTKLKKPGNKRLTAYGFRVDKNGRLKRQTRVDFHYHYVEQKTLRFSFDFGEEHVELVAPIGNHDTARIDDNGGVWTFV